MRLFPACEIDIRHSSFHAVALVLLSLMFACTQSEDRTNSAPTPTPTATSPTLQAEAETESDYEPKYDTVGHRILALESELGVKPNYQLLDDIIDESSRTVTRRETYTRDEAFEVLREIRAVLWGHRFVYQMGVGTLSQALTPRRLSRRQLEALRGRQGIASLWETFDLKGGELSPTWLEKSYILYHPDEQYCGSDCDTMSLIYLSIGEALGLPIRMVLLPNHAFLRWHFDEEDYFNFESRDLGWVPTEMYQQRYDLSDEVVEKRVYLASLTDDEVLAHGYVLRAGAWMSRSFSELALKDVDRAIALHPTMASTFRLRASILAGKRDWDSAIENFTSATLLTPDSHPLYHSRGRAYVGKGDFESAIEDFDRAHELDPDCLSLYSDRASACRRAGQPERAIGDLTTLIDLGKDEAEVYAGRANAYADTGDYERALADCEKALELDPDETELQLGIVRIYEKTGRSEEAVQVLSDMILEHPLNGAAYVRRGDLFRKMGQDALALSDAEKGAMLLLGDPVATNNLAWLLVTAKDPEVRNIERGLELAERAVRTHEEPHIVDTLAVAYAQKGDFEKAIELEEKALALLDEEAEDRQRFDRLLEHFRQQLPYDEFEEEEKLR